MEATDEEQSIMMGVGVIKHHRIVERGLIKCSLSWSMRDILHSYSGDKYTPESFTIPEEKCVYIGDSNAAKLSTSSMDSILTSMLLKDAILFNPLYKYIAFNLSSPRKETPPIIDAMKYMMDKQNKRTHIPERIPSTKNGKEELYNHLVDYIEKDPKARFQKDDEEKMKLTMRVILDALWILDGQHLKFRDASNVPNIQDSFYRENHFRLKKDFV